MRGFVSGGADVLLTYASQGQITATHQTLGTGQKVANLRTQFAIRRPARVHGFHPEHRASNIAMARAGLPCIKRLQGVQVQQGSAGNLSGGNRRPFPLDSVGLHLIPAQSHAQVGIEWHGQAKGRTILQLRGQ